MGKKIFELIKRHYIVSLILGIIIGVFVVDHLFSADYEDPYFVGKAFCYGFMTKNPKLMKEWSDRSIYKKIDLLGYSNPFTGVSHPISDFDFSFDFELDSLNRLGSTIVSSYVYGKELVYTVVLQPIARRTLWETIKVFIFEKSLLAAKLLGCPF